MLRPININLWSKPIFLQDWICIVVLEISFAFVTCFVVTFSAGGRSSKLGVSQQSLRSFGVCLHERQIFFGQ